MDDWFKNLPGEHPASADNWWKDIGDDGFSVSGNLRPGQAVPVPPVRPERLNAQIPAEQSNADWLAGGSQAPGDDYSDTGLNVPESPATQAAQQQSVAEGRRAAAMFPSGSQEPALPQGMMRTVTPRGVFHYDPAQTTPQNIRNLSRMGRENELLGLGPVSKDDAAKRIAAGEQPVVVTERTPDGTEVKAAVGTPSTELAQKAAIADGAAFENTIQTETLEGVVNGRFANGAPAPPPKPESLGGAAKDLVSAGNIDLFNTPVLPQGPAIQRNMNPQTAQEWRDHLNPPEPVREYPTTQISDGQGHKLIPKAAADGSRVLSDEEAVAQYEQTGKHLGVFKTPEAATTYAKKLSKEQGDLDKPFTSPEGTKYGMITPRQQEKERRGAIVSATDELAKTTEWVKTTQKNMLEITDIAEGRKGGNIERRRAQIGSEYEDSIKKLVAAQKALDAANIQAGPETSSERAAISKIPEALNMAPAIAGGIAHPVDAVLGTSIGKSIEAQEELYKKAFPVDKFREGEFGTKLVGGAASALGFIGIGAVGKSLGFTAKASSTAGGALHGAHEFYQDAEKHGDTGWKLARAYIIGGAIGSSEGIGLGRLLDNLEKMDKISGGGIKRYFGLVYKEAGKEGAQEYGQTFAEEMAKHGLFDKPLDDFDKNVVEAGMIGFLTGKGMAAITGTGALRKGPDVEDNAATRRADALIRAGLPDIAARNTGPAVAGAPSPVATEAPPLGEIFTPPAPNVSQETPAPAIDPAAPITPEAALAVAEALPEAAPAPGQSAELSDPVLESPALSVESPALSVDTPASALPDTPENRTLIAAGWAVEDIADMSPGAIQSAVQDAADEGIVDPGAGAVDLTLPQNVDEDAAPTSPVETSPVDAEKPTPGPLENAIVKSLAPHGIDNDVLEAVAPGLIAATAANVTKGMPVGDAMLAAARTEAARMKELFESEQSPEVKERAEYQLRNDPKLSVTDAIEAAAYEIDLERKAAEAKERADANAPRAGTKNTKGPRPKPSADSAATDTTSGSDTPQSVSGVTATSETGSSDQEPTGSGQNGPGSTGAGTISENGAKPNGDAEGKPGVSDSQAGTATGSENRTKVAGTPVPKMAAHTVATPSGRSIDVTPIVVEASSLITSDATGYDGKLQPRNRDRAASQTQIREIATNLDTNRLGVSAEADRGSPIIGDDGLVESGNGRVMAIRLAYQQNGQSAAKYREWVAAQGVDVSGMKEPVIVRRRDTEMTADERQKFTVEANDDAKLEMSASETGLADARNLKVETLDLIRIPNDLGAIQNRDFVQAFIRALPQGAQGGMTTAEGGLSAAGLTRIRNAVLAKAYGDANILARIAEATSDEIKSISNALVAVAPIWAKLRADVDAGHVHAEVDLTKELIEAVRRTADLRSSGVKFENFLAQQDAFDRLSNPVEKWMRMFYNENKKGGFRAAASGAIAERLKFYAEEARKVTAEEGLSLGLAPVTSSDLQNAAAKKGLKDDAGEGQGGLFEPSGARNGPGDGKSGAEAGRLESGTRGQEPESGSRSGDQGQKADAAKAAAFQALVAQQKVHYKIGEDLVRKTLTDKKPQLILELGDKKLLLSLGFEDSKYRITDIDKDGPSGHRDYSDTENDIRQMAQEVNSALRRGFTVREAPSPEKAKTVEAFDPSVHIKLVADDVASVRAMDVERLFEEAPKTADAFDDLRIYLIENKASLAAAVMDAIDAVGMPERVDQNNLTPGEKANRLLELSRKGQAVKDYIAKGGKVTLATKTRATGYNQPDQIRIGSDGVYVMTGSSNPKKRWDFLTDEQVDQLYAQTQTAIAKPKKTIADLIAEKEGPSAENLFDDILAEEAANVGKDSDADSMFDDILADEVAKAKPASAPQPYNDNVIKDKLNGINNGGIVDDRAFIEYAESRGLLLSGAGRNPGQGAKLTDAGRAFIGTKPTRSPAQAGISAVKNTLKGLDDVTRAASALFGDPNKMSSGLSFDEETYKKAIPIFKAGAAHFKQAGADIAEMMRGLIRHFLKTMTPAQVGNMKPYVVRFVTDVRDGKINLDQEAEDAPDSDGDLESNSGNPASQNGMGAANVPASGRGNGRGAGTRGNSAGRGRRSGDLSETNAPIVGEDGNLELPARAPRTDTSTLTPEQRERGDDNGDEGFNPDERADEAPAENAVNAASLAERLAAQRAAEKIPVKNADKANVAETLPMLFPEQQDDVFRAEQRFAKADAEPGFLLTNGTGTGKTFSGLGVIKRFHKQGKRNILIVAPSQGILNDWIKAAAIFNLQINLLDSTKDAGTGLVATTYANLGANRHLGDRDFDLVVADEAHKLTTGKDGDTTAALRNFRALTLHERGLRDRADMIFRDELDAIGDKAADGVWQRYTDKAKVKVDELRENPRPKTLFMSATPFAYHFSLDYAEGYLFSFGPEPTRTGYNVPGARENFYVSNLGYRVRFNKLTKPDAEVDTSVMERELHERLKRAGSVWGRALEVEKDYDRKFITVDDAVGAKLDQALTFLREADDGKFRPFIDMINKRFDYLSRQRLLEAIKARAAVPYLEKQFALGRKAVVFHDFNEGGGFNPFFMSLAPDETILIGHGQAAQEVPAQPVWDEFLARNPYVEQLNFAGYQAPLETLKAAFPNALIYNGTVPAKTREAAKKLFNADNNGYNLIVVQSQAGEAGISLHDITNAHQRVLLNLGSPTRPVASMQQEGRIYRVGQASDALFRYMNTGTNWERWDFASKIAQRAGTAENLGMGNQARTIKQSFIDAFLNSDVNEPSLDEGKGGKAIDRASNNALSEFQRARTHYFAQQKNTSRRNQREGVDYFATPEPLGLKMVEWANVKAGDRILEPSAGHGAIARYFPDDTHRTIVEPSSELASRAALVAGGARVINDTFENLHVSNKYDAIVMNPPFGQAGSTAIQHLTKAAEHLANGGRIVALIPRGAMDAKFDKWLEGPAKGLYQVGNMELPSVTFERAGTSISARIVILEKQTDPESMAKLMPARRDFTRATTANEFFDIIEDIDIRPRVVPVTKEPIVAAEPVKAPALPTNFKFTTVETKHTKTGDDIFIARPEARLAREAYLAMAATAKANGGFWSTFSKGFLFASYKNRSKFMVAAVAESAFETPPPPSRAQSLPQRPRLTHAAQQAGLDEAHVTRVVQGIIDNVLGRSPIQSKIVRDGLEVEGQPAAGMWDATSSLLTVSMASPDIRNTTYHEAFHALQTLGAFNERETEILKREAPRHRALLQKAYPYLSDKQLPPGETSAYTFGHYATARDAGRQISGLHIGVRRMFERGFQIMRRIKNWAQGLGFQTSEDIFERARTGQYANQENAARSWDNGTARQEMWNEDGTRPQMMPRLNQNERFPARVNAAGNTSRTGRVISAVRGANAVVIESQIDNAARLRVLQRNFQRDSGQTNLPDVWAAYGRIQSRFSEGVETLFMDEANELLGKISAAGGMEHFGRYVALKHAEEVNDHIATINPAMPDGGSGFGNTVDVRRELATFQASPDIAQLDAAANDLYAMLDRNIDRALSGGLITQKQANDYRSQYQNYVPYRGFADDKYLEMASGGGSGMSVMNVPMAKQALGRSSEADNPVVQSLDMIIGTMQLVEENRVGNMLLRQASMMEAHYGADSPFKVHRRPPTTRSFSGGQVVTSRVHVSEFKGNPDVVTTRVAGKEVFIQMKGENQLADALRNGVFFENNMPLRVAGRMTSIFSRMKTAWNPFFVATNGFRDLRDARRAVIARLGYKGFMEFHKQLPGALKTTTAYVTKSIRDPEFEEFRRMGGKMSFAKTRTVEEIRKRIHAEVHGRNAAQATGHGVISFIEGWNDIFEVTTRFGLYQAGIQQGLTREQAATLALDGTMNFSRRGDSILARGARALFPFGNPAVQSPLRTARLIADSGAGTGQKYGRMGALTAGSIAKGGFRTYGGVMIYGFLSTVWNYLMGGDDDDGIPFQDKAMADWRNKRNTMLYTGGTTDGRPNVLMGPAFPEYMAFFGIGQAIAALIFGKQSAGTVAQNYWNQVEGLNPFSGRDLGFSLLQPINQVIANRNWLDRPIHRENYKKVPAAELKFDNTAQIWQDIARVVNVIPFFNAYPEDIKYLTSQYAGGTFPMAEYLMANVAGVGTPDGRTPPVARSFYAGGDQLHRNFETEKLKKHDTEAATVAIKIKNRVHNEGMDDRQKVDAAWNNQSIIREMGGVVGPNGGINTARGQLIDKMKKEIKPMYFEMTKARKAGDMDKALNIQSGIDGIRKRYRIQADKLAPAQ